MTSNLQPPPTLSTAVHTCGDASAVHAATDDGVAVVGIGNLRVMVTHEGDHWFAQGLEIDYAAEAATLAEVKQTFADGLMRTVRENLRVFGTLIPMLQTAPDDVWAEFHENALCQRFRHSQVTVHEMQNMPEECKPPFDALDFYTKAA